MEHHIQTSIQNQSPSRARGKPRHPCFLELSSSGGNQQLGESPDGPVGFRGGPLQHSGSRHLPVSIEAKRRALQLGQFFMTQLPDEMEGETAYDEEP
ncbi:uncharacterized protein EV420DRAFT_568457 [Desarmillaria tabescens]|uniref:Uncharacterized protein n=1 Tax=Armillaria tabescens TaxID=1929756 RepID=A0AA39K6S7_ARMTA|nr:uncharacterized protein EV420DRAFT_568457 [Desarmillaria tabescens]KAK0455412.1 hypothetical protein EV420DRAFT_568457 [Desarmillaria tabescens]